MKILPSPIDGVDIVPASDTAIAPEALPFSVAIHNRTTRTIALIGVRFDITGSRGEKYTVVHYADMLRDPSRAELRPDTMRTICAEPSYTARRPDARGKMNLDNLRRMLNIEASLDCIAFEDGSFKGPDSRGAFERLNSGREAEAALIAEVLASDDPRTLLGSIKGDLARKLLASEDPRAAAAAHRCRILLVIETAPEIPACD